MSMLRKECFPKKTDKEEVAVFGMLVEALRIKHNPVHYDFKMRYVYYELPPEVVERLVNLHFVKNMERIFRKNIAKQKSGSLRRCLKLTGNR